MLQQCVRHEESIVTIAIILRIYHSYSFLIILRTPSAQMHLGNTHYFMKKVLQPE